MTSHGSIPIDKNMDEILASIRQTIQEDLSEQSSGTNLYPSSSPKSPVSNKSTLSSDKQDDDILELTQMLSDDGTVVDLKDATSKKGPQPILRRPYSPLDRTPATDLRHYQGPYAKVSSDNYAEKVNDYARNRVFESQIDQQHHRDTVIKEPYESRTESIDNTSGMQHSDDNDKKSMAGFDSGYRHDINQIRQTLPQIEQNSDVHHPINVDTNSSAVPLPSAYETTLTDVATYESTKPSAIAPPANAYESIAARSEDQIMSNKTIQDSLAALGSLNIPSSIKNDQNSVSDSVTLSAQQTIEDLVRELLRPLLKEWLDANLPTLVKWVVTEQVERVFKQQQNTSQR